MGKEEKKKEGKKTELTPKEMNCKQLFAVKMPEYSYPASMNELVNRLSKAKGGHTETFKAYIRWAKRKRNPFPFVLEAKGKKYTLVTKDPDPNA